MSSVRQVLSAALLATSLATSLVFGLAGCPKGGLGSEPQKSAARFEGGDAGPIKMVFGPTSVVVPAEDVARDRLDAPIMQDASGHALWYRTPSGHVRFVYLIGGELFFGPSILRKDEVRQPIELDGALAGIFENTDASRRPVLVDVLQKEKGDAAVARMLAGAAHVDSSAWDAAFAKLSPEASAHVKKDLAAALDKGKPPGALKRTVVHVDLRDPARAPVLAARIRELSEPLREPAASAAMLRALTVSDKAQAATVACELLGKKTLASDETPRTMHDRTDRADNAGRDLLVEASTLAIANAGTDCPAADLARLVTVEPCQPYYRCGAEGPLSGRETTKQDEPVCTKEQLAAAVPRELERKPADIVSGNHGPRPGLFALAILANKGQVPAPFTAAHERRRFMITQPAEPLCDVGVALGSPCHCDEAIIRDQLCRHESGGAVSIGLCKFEIDDKQKKALNVVATSPP